jgi:hypothetical protein
MGGIILYTLPKSSLRDKLAAMLVDVVYCFLVNVLDIVVSIKKLKYNKWPEARNVECFCFAASLDA